MSLKTRGLGADPVSGYLRSIHANQKVVKALTHALSRPIAVRPEHLGRLIRNDAGAVVDFLIGASPFYGCDAQVMSRQQVADYFEQNPQDERGLGLITKDDALLYQFATEIDREAPQPFMLQPQLSGFGSNYRAPKSYCATLVIFGLGLGYHLEPLIRLYRPLRIVLFEPHIESWAASMAVLDWERLQQACRQAGTEFVALHHDDPAQIPFVILEAVKRGSGALSCFIRYFRHHGSPAIEAARESFEKVVPFLTSPEGYLADELRQVEQTARNLRDRRILTRPFSPGPVRESCAMVIGSGPSLDSSLEILRDHRATACVISCGTALRKLLDQSIVPDLHIELETHPTILPKLYEDLGGRTGGIQFFGSSGIPDSALRYFDRPILFFRHNSTSSSLADGLAQSVPYAVARVGTAGAALAAFLGYETIVMLGMDNGYLPGGADHAEGTIYEEQIGHDVVDMTFEGTESVSPDIQRIIRSERNVANIPALSVTGGTIMMENSFLLAVSSLHQLAESRPDCKFYQVGFGAFIKGATNVVPEDYRALRLQFKRSALIADWIDGIGPDPDVCRQYLARLSKTARVLKEITADVKRIHARPIGDIADFARNDRDAIRRLDTHWKPIDRSAFGLIRGTILTLGKVTIERAMMHQDAETRSRFLKIAQRHLLATIDAAIELCEKALRADFTVQVR